MEEISTDFTDQHC